MTKIEESAIKAEEIMDSKYGNAISQVRYIYARDVLMRFKQYTPAGVSVRHYFEYNPKTGKFVNK